MWLQSFSGVTFIHTSNCLLESVVKRHTHRPISTLDCVYNTPIYSPIATFDRVHNAHIHRGAQSVGKIRRSYTHPYSQSRLIACTNTQTLCDAFLSSVSFLHMQHYTPIAYLFRQCGKKFQQRRPYCRLYCETFGHGVPVFQVVYVSARMQF